MTNVSGFFSRRENPIGRTKNWRPMQTSVICKNQIGLFQTYARDN